MEPPVQKFSIRDTLKVVDVSKEIVLDVMFLTTDLLHAIRNNLPIDMSSAQVSLQGVRVIDVPETAIVEIMPAYRRRRAWVALVVMGVFIVAAAFGAVFTYQELQAKKIGDALMAAHHRVNSAAYFETDTVDIRLEAARNLLVQGHPARAALLLEPVLDSRRRDEVIEVLAPAWLATDRFEDVRSLVSKSGVNTERPAILTDSFNQSWELDPRLSLEPKQLTAENIVLISEGFYSVEFDGLTWSLEIPTVDRPDDWQDSIAAHRLCIIIGCAFLVPESGLVSVEIDGVETLGALIPTQDDGLSFPIERVRGWRICCAVNRVNRPPKSR